MDSQDIGYHDQAQAMNDYYGHEKPYEQGDGYYGNQDSSVDLQQPEQPQDEDIDPDADVDDEEVDEDEDEDKDDDETSEILVRPKEVEENREEGVQPNELQNGNFQYVPEAEQQFGQPSYSVQNGESPDELPPVGYVGVDQPVEYPGGEQEVGYAGANGTDDKAGLKMEPEIVEMTGEPADGPEVVVEPAVAAPTTTGEATPTTTLTQGTPAPGKPATSTPMSIKDRISQIPARLSRFSLLNALRSGTYVVSEPKTMSDTEGEQPKVAPGDEEEEDREKVLDNGGVVDETGPEVPLTKVDHEQQELAMTSILSSSKKRHSVHRSALTKLLCGLYALLLVVFGIVFSVANSLTVKERQHLYYLEVFQLYLYVGSLVVLLYFQICILRGVRVRNNYFDNNIRVVIRRSQDNLQLTPSPTRKGELEHVVVETEDTFDPRRPIDQMSTLSTRSQMAAPADGQVAHVGEGINFYLRLGCLAFSIGSVTLDGFHIASYFETENTTTCESYIFTIVYVLHLIFTFIQTFFLFKNHKLVIDKNKASVRFGLMHLLATNLCVWFVTAITETAEDFKQQKYLASNRTTVDGVKSCYEDMTLARTASPYLFPSTIIYSIIAAGILYRMYQYVGVKVSPRWPSHTSLTSSVPQGAVGMDCEKANKGLFSGLLIGVITVIAIATFFVFESRLNYPQTAIKIFLVMEIALILVTGLCIMFGILRFASLKFLENYLSLDSVLLVISLGGAYIYLSFMLISSASMVEKHGMISVLSLAVICVGIIESTLQSIFILDGLCRRAGNDTQVENKPGRAVVTFLLVCNLALWVVSMFEIKKTMVVPFHLEFYGILPWNIMLHLCVPLFIYFRFHSAICLSKIWYHAYQKDRGC